MTSAILAVFVPIVLLAVVARLVLQAHPKMIAFSPERANMRMRTRTGGNATAVLAAIALSQATLDVLRVSPAVSADLSGAVIAALLVAFVFALAVADKEAGFLLAVLGVSASIVGTWTSLGVPGVMAMLALSLPLIWILGLSRGFFR